MKDVTAFDGASNSTDNSTSLPVFQSQHLESKSPENAKKTSIYLTIKPDQGGRESRDFCTIMQRMILKYCADEALSVEIVNDSEYEIILRITDKYENWDWMHGFHKIVRVSPFGKNDKIQTSLCRINISNPKKKLNIVINDKDLRIDCFKSTGPGGQHRNKTMSAVRITHLPTRIVTVSAAERSQHNNKEYAMEQLMEKLKDYEDNLELMKHEEKRRQILSTKENVLTFYYNHKMVVNEKLGIKSTNLKNVLNGDLNEVKKSIK